MNQKKHHMKRTFLDEYRELLEKFEVPFDERYFFKLYRVMENIPSLTGRP